MSLGSSQGFVFLKVERASIHPEHPFDTGGSLAIRGEEPPDGGCSDITGYVPSTVPSLSFPRLGGILRQWDNWSHHHLLRGLYELHFSSPTTGYKPLPKVPRRDTAAPVSQSSLWGRGFAIGSYGHGAVSHAWELFARFPPCQ